MTRPNGYTLTEMLVVIGVIGLIAAVLTPGLVGQMGRARMKAAELQIDTVAGSVEMFRTDVGRLPRPEEGLQVLITPPEGADGWTGPYLRDRKLLKDPWGAALLYEVTPDANRFTIRSLGADGRPGGTGINRDIVAPDDGL